MKPLFHHKNTSSSGRTEVVLGMDGGGTKTEVLITDLNGEIIASHTGGPTNLAAVPESVALNNLEAALSSVFKQARRVRVKAAVIGMAGIDTLSDEARFRPFADATLESFGIFDYVLLNDSAVALANGTDADNAIILIAGTGSICYGHSADGKTARAGGMDYLLADEGSGYWIGRKVLRAVVRANDGRGLATAMTPLVLKHFKITEVNDLKQKVYQPQLSKMSIAELAKVWETALNDGDEVAKIIQKQIIDKLELLVEAVARSLKLSDASFDLVLAGSIVQLPVVEPLLRARLLKKNSRITIIIPTTSPAHGAIKLALKALSTSEAA
jgi:N-acetylglucosamine kinase-like BadF-type ATPase